MKDHMGTNKQQVKLTCRLNRSGSFVETTERFPGLCHARQSSQVATTSGVWDNTSAGTPAAVRRVVILLHDTILYATYANIFGQHQVLLTSTTEGMSRGQSDSKLADLLLE